MLIERPWSDLSFSAHAEAIVERLDAGAAWISGSAREARWLASALSPRDGLLSPSPAALERVDTPPGELASRLGLQSPPMLSALADDYRLNAFGREHGWSVCLRGPGRRPTRLSGWRSFETARAHVAGAWSHARLRLQAEVEGTAESIVFAAHRGRMLGARHMQPGIEAVDGSAWSGRMTGLEEAIPGIEAKLADELSQARWTGGGELEIVRSPDRGAWLIACHPRFPAWVHGATLTGANLPAQLIAAATGRTPALADVRGSEFVRVVIDIPLRPLLPLPPGAPAASGVVRAGDYLSGMPDPTRRRSARASGGPARSTTRAAADADGA